MPTLDELHYSMSYQQGELFALRIALKGILTAHQSRNGPHQPSTLVTEYEKKGMLFNNHAVMAGFYETLARAAIQVERVGAQTNEGPAVEFAADEGRVVAEELSHSVFVSHGNSLVRHYSNSPAAFQTTMQILRTFKFSMRNTCGSVKMLPVLPLPTVSLLVSPPLVAHSDEINRSWCASSVLSFGFSAVPGQWMMYPLGAARRSNSANPLARCQPSA